MLIYLFLFKNEQALSGFKMNSKCYFRENLQNWALIGRDYGVASDKIVQGEWKIAKRDQNV